MPIPQRYGYDDHCQNYQWYYDRNEQYVRLDACRKIRITFAIVISLAWVHLMNKKIMKQTTSLIFKLHTTNYL
jgi:hypothetical protein